MTEGQIFANRFRCTASIKCGSGTATLRGTDLHEQRDVIIKTVALSAVAPDAFLRLEHEARILGTLHTPYLTPVIELGRQDGQVYVVTPAVPGITLEARLTRGPLTTEETLVVGRSLCAALQQAHEHGILHRDVKPANVIVDDETPLRRATLIDFGFARSPLLEASIREIPVGTIRYMAPEQAGVLNRSVDERADLYAVGLVLFECLAGRSPFRGTTVAEVLREQLSTSPPDLRSLGCAVPRALDEILHRLLRKDPDDRYQTAEGVLADLTAVADAVEGGVADPPLVVGLRDSRRTLAEPAFVGRQEELASLDAQWERARSGRGGLVLLEAESGGGKTRVLDEFARRSGQRGAWVLRGQGLDQAAQRPFQLLDGVVQGLLARGKSDRDFAPRLAERLGDQRDAMCEAVPHLAVFLKVDSTQPLSLGHEAHGEVRSLRALMCLLDALGSPEQPAVVLLDDVQWADDLAVKLLDQWSRREPNETHVLIVGAFRAEEVSADQPLRRVPASARFVLAPFSASDLHRLAESMAGRLPKEALDVIVRLAEGSPFMATAVLQGLVEAGALMPTPLAEQKWQLDHSVLDDIRSSRRAAVFLARRLDYLPGETLRLLSVGAVLGKEFDPRFAGDLAGLSEDAVAAWGLEARRRHLLWCAETGIHWAFVHDKIRETLLKRLADDERRHLHAAAAARLEAEDPQRIFELAYHFDEAGAHARALPYALAAAEHARARSALEIAERQYRIAERALNGADAATRRHVAEGLGDTLMLRGRYDEAQRYLQTAASLAGDAVERAQLQGKLGELAFKRGDVRAASVAVEQALQSLGEPVPHTRLGTLGWMSWEIVIQGLHTILPNTFILRRSIGRARRDLLAARLYSRLAYAYWFGRGALQTLWAHLRELNMAERYPPSRELGQAYANHSVVMTVLPLFKRGIVYAEKSRELRERLGDLWGVGQSFHFSGLALLAAARNLEALVAFREAARRLERTGDLWELGDALFNTAHCLYRLGDLRGAARLGKQVFQSGGSIGSARDVAAGLEIWAKATGGKVPRDLLQAEVQRVSDDVHTAVTVMQAEAVCLIGEHQFVRAKAVLSAAQRLVRQAGLRSEYVVPNHVWLTTVLRREIEEMSPYQTSSRRLLIRRACRAARQALGHSRYYRNSLPHALRELGLLAAMSNKPRKARRYLDESLAVATRQAAKFEHAQTLLVRGEVGVGLQWPGAADEVKSARDALRALGAYWVLGEEESKTTEEPITPGLIDRFDTVLEIGRKITSALTREAVYNAVQQGALGLLRGEDCVVLGISERRLEPESGQAQLPTRGAPFYSRTVVDQAVETGRPVVMSEGISDQTNESLVLSGARSILCAPITVQGRIVSCFYVTHRQVGGLFGKDEERLAEFIATLAGAALENVEGMGRIEHQLIAGSAAGLAHAIKSPVAVVRAYLSLLPGVVEAGDRAKFAEYLQTMEGAVDRIGDLVRRLHRVRIDGSCLHPVNVERIIGQAVEEVRTLFPKAGGYRIAVDVAPDSPDRITADGEQLVLAFTNLLTNAGQAMPGGGLIRIAVRPDGDGRVAISISDQGEGIPATLRPRLFEPFVTTRTEGTGLGLWVCRKIVEQHHHGRIDVSSCSEWATTVTVTLPIAHSSPVS